MREKGFTKQLHRQETEHKSEILKMAVSYRHLNQSDEFAEHRKLIARVLKTTKNDYDVLKNFTVDDILKDTQKYLLKRVEIETRIAVLEHVLDMPQKYIKAAEEFEK